MKRATTSEDMPMICMVRRCVAVVLLVTGCTRIIDLGENLDPDTAADASVDAGAQDAAANAPDADHDDGEADASTRPDADSGAPVVGRSYVFVTRAEYQGNLGGLEGADLRCTSSANGAGLAGTYRAWLSSPDADAKDRIEGEGPWLEPGTDVVLFRTRASLTGFPEGPPARDEYGEEAPDRWWTGTRANGLRDADTCQGWTSSAQAIGGMTGTRLGEGRPGKEWTEDAAYSCVDSDVQKFALLCFGPM